DPAAAIQRPEKARFGLGKIRFLLGGASGRLQRISAIAECREHFDVSRTSRSQRLLAQAELGEDVGKAPRRLVPSELHGLQVVAHRFGSVAAAVRKRAEGPLAPALVERA